MSQKIAKNGKEVVDYDKIPAYPKGQFMNAPGCYCENCGQTFALYFYSAIMPAGVDENGKPVFNNCFKCEDND
jgi:hypothetical protein